MVWESQTCLGQLEQVAQTPSKLGTPGVWFHLLAVTAPCSTNLNAGVPDLSGQRRLVVEHPSKLGTPGARG